ncbi:Uncharacterized conserved protein PhnB, glyoxalase superfamily [Amycolatopsis xylanica]|uniref:Uncharacterized conserved protein PhnB, glyoxalase superfamily n=1 Tax=Amycolatopsis xylanica TaxID=589385 RepID=A0A1H3T0L8_9PSEU|nr:VOC family protein [Amycolatopsis xylanica]SDZ43371.1 Uncharacterized conserved protein PhnB, glyoxalase superfamily [Amycolatopsis xylanica]
MNEIWPALRYDDAPAALKFLTGVFGFSETLVVPGETGDIVHAEIRWPGGGGVMFSGTAYCAGVHGEIKAGGNAVYVVVSDVDTVYERVRAGAEIADPIADTEYGSRAFTARDTEGNLWTFGTYKGAA